MAEPSFRHKGSWMQLPISSDVKLQSNMEGGDSRKHLGGGEGENNTGTGKQSALHFLFKKVPFIYHSRKDHAGFVDVISAAHQHYNDQFCSQPLFQPSLAKLSTFFFLLRQSKERKKKSHCFPSPPG